MTNIPVGATVEGRVRNLTDFGAFIEIEEGIDGLVHVSNLSWTKRVKHPSEVLKKGDRVKAIVLAIEPDKRRLSLGVKQLQPDVWEIFLRTASRRRRGSRQSPAGGHFRRIRRNRRRHRRSLPQQSEAVDANGQPLTLEPGVRARLQDHQDESGRKESRLEHQGSRRGSLPLRSRSLQATGIEHRRFDHRRADVLEARRRRKQLRSDS